jgi:exopolyphosphatase / guanosine-5'-triphosphate,3'-diphosphate pyrophosphatase
MRTTFAVADLGTNTFQFLIAEKTATGFNELVNMQEMVKLGEGGINKGLIQPAAFERGIVAVQKFRGLLDRYSVVCETQTTGAQAIAVRAIATSALRNAANGKDFINEVKAKTGIEIEIIDGDKEAGFIYNGIASSGCLSEKNSLIVDIGGGSVEFIIGNVNGIKWKQSFEIGAARLMDKFHKTDPIPGASIVELNNYLEDNLPNLFTAISNYAIENIIGSSGAFETFAELIEREKGSEFDLKINKLYNFNIDEFLSVIDKLILSSHQQRLNTKGIIPVRTDMIVSASLVTRFVIEKTTIKNIVMCSSSLKEGVLAEMMAG